MYVLDPNNSVQNNYTSYFWVHCLSLREEINILYSNMKIVYFTWFQ